MKQTQVALIFILLLATGLRFHNLDAQSFWNDEGNSARLSERPVRLIIEGTASDVHPPLYYLILHGYRGLVGGTEFALRSVSAFAGVLLVALTVPLAAYMRRSSKARQSSSIVGLVSALLVAINPALVYYSQETRMYMLLPLLAILSTVLLLRWLQTDGIRNRWLIAYGLVMTAGLYTHYFFPIVFVIHAMMCLLEFEWRRMVKWGAVVAAAWLLFLPWLPIVLRGLGGNRGVAQTPQLYLTTVTRWLFTGGTDVPMPALFPLLPGLLLGALLLIMLFKRLRWHAWLLFFVPLATLPVLGATDVAFFKFVLLAICGLSVLLAQASFSMLQSRRYEMLPAIIMLSWLFILNLRGVQAQATDPQFYRADYRGMAARISAENHPNAGIILNAPNQWEVFTYYHQAGAPVYPLPRTRDYAEVLTELETIGDTHDRLYVLYWGDAQQDPDRWVENWLAANAFKASEEWVKDVRFVVYALSDEWKLVMNSAEIDFNQQISLTQTGLNRTELRSGDILKTAFVWQAQQKIEQRYKIFVHLLDPDGRLVAQKDSEPAQMTLDWAVGDPVTTQHGILIPANLASGTYTLVVGLYDVADPSERLPVSELGQSLGTTYTLAEIRVQE
ncbi:MAG: glycosyltransferase family 39 protein [Candidatus Promineifilaceae bacterium]